MSIFDEIVNLPNLNLQSSDEGQHISQLVALHVCETAKLCINMLDHELQPHTPSFVVKMRRISMHTGSHYSTHSASEEARDSTCADMVW
jgi:hypothetical protein